MPKPSTHSKELSTANPVAETSRSQKKREANAVFKLGRQIVALSDGLLKRLELSQPVLEAVQKARGMRSHGAQKRQLLFLAKLLRQEDTLSLQAAYDRLLEPDRQETRALHRIEQWRDHLLSGGKQAITDLSRKLPDAPFQRIRQLVRQAAKEAQFKRPPASARQLFKLLRGLEADNGLPSFSSQTAHSGKNTHESE